MFIFVKSFVWTFIYSISFFLFYNQVYNRYPGDMPAHIEFINNLDLIAHPLWHLSVQFISELFSIPIRHSIILFTSSLVLSTFIIITAILDFILKDELHFMRKAHKQYLLLFASLILLIVSAIYFPFFNQSIYLGQSACGIWHNVTLLMVKPFAFLSMFFTILYIHTKNTKFFILGFIFTITSIFAKPSFIIVFLPSLYLFILYYLYKEENRSLKELLHIKKIFNNHKHIFIYLFIITLVSIGILISQFLTIFGETNPVNSKIIFDFLGVWSSYTPNVVTSLLLTVMFPLLTLIFIRPTKNDFYILSVIMFIISILIYSLFAESGHRYYDGNFAWTMHITYHILFVFSVIEFLKGYQALNDWKKYLLSITLSLHILSGLFYLGKILSGMTYV